MDPRSRWEIAGGTLVNDPGRVQRWREAFAEAEAEYEQEIADGADPQDLAFQRKWAARWYALGPEPALGRLIALKGDPVWGELGSSENFEDALDVDHPPFAFNSGMAWREISLEETRALGVTGPEGETIEEWQASEPVVMDGRLPRPTVSTAGMDTGLRRHLEKELGATVEPGKNGRPEVLRAPEKLPEGATKKPAEAGAPGATPAEDTLESILRRGLERRSKEYAER